MPKSVNIRSYAAVRSMLDAIFMLCNIDCDNHCEDCILYVMDSTGERQCLKEFSDRASRAIQIDAEECNCNA